MNFSLHWKDLRRSSTEALGWYGLTEIGQHLKAAGGHARAIGLVQEPVMFRIPARYEDLSLIAYSRPEYVADPWSMLSFMHKFRISYLILPAGRFDAGSFRAPPTMSAAAIDLQNMCASRIVEDRSYLMIDVSQVTEKDWQKALQRPDGARANAEPRRNH
jgi:hypothetical protein